jgi:hypothetical protein
MIAMNRLITRSGLFDDFSGRRARFLRQALHGDALPARSRSM